ncbi:F0F1 ATP synthase subunit B [Phenylobacterium soli]|uniref:ATP synthase subunit b n=1 Tax=Phenylobacterium soli TaxID=2170551 RepID=A0A328AJJ0_9CAUL|nr:F0F1 ATP synthase subunit B [Phenylobacterium soli]RAK54236.1 ATP F0F1 synthase subunit B [Phenylobacterium soli]
MPAFFEPEFWSLANPELWVGIGLLVLLAIMWRAGAFKIAMGSLDAKAAKIQADLDEAARIREEAQRLLETLKAERAAAERHAQEVLAQAQAEAERLAAETRASLAESLQRRQEIAERRIASAEAQAAAEVKAAAIDLAARAAESVMAGRLAGAKSDPLVDSAIGQLAAKLQ